MCQTKEIPKKKFPFFVERKTTMKISIAKVVPLAFFRQMVGSN